jgi:N-ethylmaleimide reductase
MNETKTNQLFSPIEIGSTRLKHRVVMAPLTRSRSKQPDGIPSDLMLEYYCQRASDGGLIIAEAAQLSIRSRGWNGAPGMYSAAQVDGWKKIVDVVHAKGGRIFAQLWHPGRFSHVTLTEGATPVSSSVDPGYWQDPSCFVSTPVGWIQPSPHRALEKSEIPRILNEFSEAVEHAKAAGFDGVEVHAGNGYLIDQFLQDGSNKRIDEYGGSIENRCRLLFEVVEAMVSAWASDRISVRITPSGTFNAMSDSNPETLHAHVVEGLNRFGLAYLHIIEPRMSGSLMIKENYPPVASQRARKIFKGKIIANGGFEPGTAAAAVAQGDADAIAFGRYFVSNPDLPRRIREGLPLAAYDRDTFYTFDAKGYTDYPFYNGAAAA